MDLSIIIVNWNSIEFTQACAASIHSTITGLQYEVIVVDNASEAESCRRLSESIAEVKVVCLPRNIGFAAANNLGVDHSSGRVILFLNPDTLVLGDAIQHLFVRLNSSPQTGAAGCRLLNGDLSLQTSCVRPFPNILNQVFAIEWLKEGMPALSLWGMRALFAEHAGELQEVEAVSGACLMVKRDVFDTVGKFSTDYFMYAEDTDLCYKIRQAGWSVGYLGEAQIVHFGGQSTKNKEDAFADVMIRESVFKLLRKFRGKRYAELYRASLFVSAALRVTLLSPLLVLPSWMLNRGAVCRACRKWRHIAAWSLGLAGRAG
jgi:N-acetylglucosaminyl-diphospho-decaprenol L-rhamnosyltransferase